MIGAVYYFERQPSINDPGGITVGKQSKLPPGDFKITEYCWGDVSLWFIDADKFTEIERELAYQTWMLGNVEEISL